MRVFMVSAYRDDIYAEILRYDPKTKRARVRHANGVEYDRNLGGRYTAIDYRIQTEEELNDAQQSQLRAGYPAREAHREEAG